MSDIAGHFAIYRFVMTLLFVIGGILCIYFGYRLFSNGAGLYQSIDKLAVKHKEFTVSISGMSAGAVLMASSVAWAYFGYSSVPRLEFAGDNTGKITGTTPTSTPRIVVGAPVFTPDNRPAGRVTHLIVGAGGEERAVIASTQGEQKVIELNKATLRRPTSGQAPAVVFSSEDIQTAPKLDFYMKKLESGPSGGRLDIPSGREGQLPAPRDSRDQIQPAR